MRILTSVYRNLIPALVVFALQMASAAAQPLADPVETAPDYRALTSNERWRRYWNESARNPGLYVATLGSAVGQQLHNGPPEWHQGLKGYARRSASQLGLFSLQTGIGEATAAALHYEPRYVRSGRTGFLPRLGHAMQWTFLTWDANRHVRFNVPAVASAYGSGMISMAWYPSRYSALHDGVRIGNQQMGVAVGTNVIREFGPELKRLVHWKP